MLMIASAPNLMKLLEDGELGVLQCSGFLHHKPITLIILTTAAKTALVKNTVVARKLDQC